MQDQDTSVYAGRWVARIRGKIVAQGNTPEEALRAAQRSRHKEKPEIIYMSHPSLLDKVRDVLPPTQDVYLVGGAVRDMILGRASHDLDFATPTNGISLARSIANTLHADFIPLDTERDTGRVILSNPDGSQTYLDFATYRGDTLEEDLRARDFTLNAIAYDLKTNALIDPLHGEANLRAKLIRACTETSLHDDPLRILRAVRQAAAFNFKIDIPTRGWMKDAAPLLSNVSAERLRDELFKMLNGPRPHDSMRALEMLGTFPHLMPELSAMKGVEQSLPHVHDVWEHTLNVLKHLEGMLAALASSQAVDDPFNESLRTTLGKFWAEINVHETEALTPERSARAALFFAALFHDVAKPATQSVEAGGRIRFFDHDVQGAEVAASRARAFNLSNDEVERIRKIIFHHMRFHFFTSQWEGKGQEPSRKSIYRFFRDAGTAGIDLILLGLADLRGIRDQQLTEENWRAALGVATIFLTNYFEKREETIAPPRLVDGNELMKEFELEPGRIIGQLLEAIREEQAIGNVSTRDDVLSFARKWLDENQPV